ncbi:MAG: hypothetical protein K2K09_06710 [Lachnospiraceae bacterium]|nr:hypothetical protein [Lachnospiraceae bacterium]
MNIIFPKKRAVIIIMLFLITCLLSVSGSRIIHANNNSELHTFNEYSVYVPDSFTVDSETLQDFTSFYGDNVTIGIRVADNTIGENVTTLTESKISDITTDTLSSLMAQAGEGINVKEHSITTFSDRAYPALYIAFAGSSDLDADVYIEEYIITTVSYKYTIVFSADNKEMLETDDVNQFKNSFTTTEAPLKQVVPADSGQLNVILGICAAGVIVFLIVTVLIVRKQGVRKH